MLFSRSEQMSLVTCERDSGAMMALQSAIFIRRAYAGAVSRVERKRTAHPKRLRAKNVTTTSKLDGVKSATTGAFSADGSYGN